MVTKARQCMNLPAGQDVTLNIGLNMGQYPSRMSIPHRLRVWTKALPEVMEAGYIAELHLTPKRVWRNEPMLVVQGTLKPNVNTNTLLWDAVVDSEQDCIAIYEHIVSCPPNQFGAGELFGPRSEAWGEFNINFFYFIGDKHEA